MRDDLLDLAGDEDTLGKPVGGDLREGKATLPVLLLLDSPQQKEVRDVLARRAAAEGDVARVRDLALATGAVDATREEIGRRVALAVDALGALPPPRRATPSPPLPGTRSTALPEKTGGSGGGRPKKLDTFRLPPSALRMTSDGRWGRGEGPDEYPVTRCSESFSFHLQGGVLLLQSHFLGGVLSMRVCSER